MKRKQLIASLLLATASVAYAGSESSQDIALPVGAAFLGELNHGFDAVIGRPIREITLDATPLGSASLLGKPAYDQGDPAFQLGREGHIGITTRLG